MIVGQHAWNGAGRRLASWIARPLTFLCVMLAWVPFRAPSMDAAAGLYASMAGITGPQGAPAFAAPGAGVLLLVLAGALIALLAPNAKRISESAPRGALLALACGLLAGAALVKQLYAGEIHEFIYFRF